MHKREWVEEIRKLRRKRANLSVYALIIARPSFLIIHSGMARIRYRLVATGTRYPASSRVSLIFDRPLPRSFPRPFAHLPQSEIRETTSNPERVCQLLFIYLLEISLPFSLIPLNYSVFQNLKNRSIQVKETEKFMKIKKLDYFEYKLNICKLLITWYVKF